MKRKLYLHIGSAKTGTKSIQDFMYSNRDTLSKFNIYYPDFTISSKHIPFSLYFEIGNKESLDDFQKNDEQFAKTENEFKIIKASAKDILISSEILFAYADQEKLLRMKEAFPEFEFRIICYLRRQDLFIESSYNQHVKVGNTSSLEEFIKWRNCNWLDRLLVYKEIFGSDNIIIRPFERSQFVNQDLIDDFLNILNINNLEKFIKPDHERNVSFRPEIVKMIKMINTSGLDIDKIEIFRYFKENMVNPYTFRKINYLNNKQRGQIIDQYKESNDEIARLFLGKEQGSLFTEPETDQIEIKPEDDTLLWGEALMVLIELLMNQDNKIKELACQLEMSSKKRTQIFYNIWKWIRQ